MSDFDQIDDNLPEDEDGPITKKVKEKRGHALEKYFDIPEGSTEEERIMVSYPLKKSEEYDDKDSEIEKELHKVFEKAMEGYESLSDIIDSTEPKYRARMAEVAATYLNTALNASTKRASQKESIQKLIMKREEIDKKAATGKTTNNIAFIGNRNDLLKLVMQEEQENEKDKEAIDIEAVEVEEPVEQKESNKD